MPNKPATQQQLLAENDGLRARLARAEAILCEMRSGEVDALVVPEMGGAQLFTLKDVGQSFRILIEEMSEGALTMTAEGVIVYANRHFAGMLKTPLEKVIGSAVHTWIAPGSQPILQSLLEKSAGEERRAELVLAASDGTGLPVHLSVINLPIEGRPDAYCLVAIDLTAHKRIEAIAASERVARELLAAANQSRGELLRVIEDKSRAEVALRESEAKYRDVVTQISDGIFITDDRGTLTFCNPALARIHGCEQPEQLVGRRIMEFVAPASLNEVADHFRQVVEGKLTMAQLTIDILHRDGTQGVVEVSANTKREGGKFLGTFGIVRDITERKRAAEALRIAGVRLEALTRRLLEVQETERRLIASELHDEVGGMLTAVKLNLQALRRAHTSEQGEAALADGFALVDGAIQSVRSLSLDLRPVVLDDLGLIPALKWYCERQAQRAGVAIELTLDAIDLKPVPQLETACFRIVQEAVTNALRHGGARRIQVTLRRYDDRFAIEIVDDGTGFDPATARKRGLAGECGGLLGMEERAKLLGGRLSIDSAAGAGARVSADFEIPEGGFA